MQTGLRILTEEMLLGHPDSERGSDRKRAVCRQRQSLEDQPQAQTAAAPEAGGGRKHPPLEPPEATQPCPHLDMDVWPPEL